MEEIATIKVQLGEDSFDEFKVRSDLRGKIEEVFFTDGDTVKVGQPLLSVLHDEKIDNKSVLDSIVSILSALISLRLCRRS